MKRTVYPCGRVSAPFASRREWLRRAGCGFGAVAASALLSNWAKAASRSSGNPDHTNPLAPKPTHYAPKVKRVVYLYMDGGPSQVETWDPKPQLTKEHGQPFKMTI